MLLLLVISLTAKQHYSISTNIFRDRATSKPTHMFTNIYRTYLFTRRWVGPWTPHTHTPHTHPSPHSPFPMKDKTSTLLVQVHLEYVQRFVQITLRCVLLWLRNIIFYPYPLGLFTGTDWMLRLPQCQRNNHEEYGYMIYSLRPSEWRIYSSVN